MVVVSNSALLADEVVEKMGSGEEDTSEDVKLSVEENTSLEEVVVVVVVRGSSSKIELEIGDGKDTGGGEEEELSEAVVERGGSSKTEDVVYNGGSSKAELVLLMISLDEEVAGALVGVPT